MLPSDHFVRMYNELFKMLHEMGNDHLETYWKEISRLQDTILGPYIEQSGLRGMYEYWGKIIEEENCEGRMELTDEYFEFTMLKCPSLMKNLDNDAGLFSLYCDHCAGWIGPLAERHGYHLAYDIISRDEPRCRFRIYRDADLAAEFEGHALLPAGRRLKADR